VPSSSRKYATPRKEAQLAKLIKCECGFIARGETDDEVIDKIESHLGSDHPHLVGKVTREDLSGMIEEA
jgi:predicted small metal-binding protein